MRPHRNPKKFNAGFRARPAGDFPVYSAHPWASPCGPAFGSSDLFQTNLSAKVTKTIPPRSTGRHFGGCPAPFPRCGVSPTDFPAAQSCFAGKPTAHVHMRPLEAVLLAHGLTARARTSCPRPCGLNLARYSARLALRVKKGRLPFSGTLNNGSAPPPT